MSSPSVQMRMPMQIQAPPSYGSKAKTQMSLFLSSSRSKLGCAKRINAFENKLKARIEQLRMQQGWRFNYYNTQDPYQENPWN